MNDRAVYRRLEAASTTLLLIIAIAIALLLFGNLPRTVFKISLTVLLLTACGIFWLLRQAISETLRRGNQRFKNAELKFEKLMESNLIGILISNKEGIVKDANEAFLDLLGYTGEDLAASKVQWENVIAERSRPELRSQLHLEKQGIYKPVEKQLVRKDGHQVWVLCGSASLYETNESPIISYIIDITQAKEAEEKAVDLQERIVTQKEEFESIFMHAPAYIYIRRGPDLQFQFVNKAFNKILGRGNQIDKRDPDRFKSLSDQGQTMAEEVYRSATPIKRTAHRIEFDDEFGKQQVIYLDFMFNPVFDHKGQVDGVAFFGYDVTDLVMAFQEVELSNDKFVFLADSMPHKVSISNAEGDVQWINKAWREYAGVGDQEGFLWLESIHPDEAETVRNVWEQCIKNGTEYNHEGRFRRFDGEYRWHLTHAVPFKDSDGRIVYWVGINTDIHDQKLQLQHLQDNEAYFRALSEETPFIVWKSDREGKCVYLNRKWVEITGLSMEESLGNGYRKALLIDDFEAYRQNWMDTVRTHSFYQDKFRLKTAEGSFRWVFSQANPHYVNSVFDGYVGSIVDITEQELSNRAIKELSEKKDEFLSIASHELKTPLTSIKASIQLIARAISTDHRASQFAVKASEQLMRLERLISDLLDVSKINSGRLVYNNSVFYFREMLQEVVQNIQHTTPTHRIIVERSDKVIVLGDRFRLEQVVYNFLSNAVKYSPEADKVIVASKVVNDNLVVSIQDFGIGMSSENLGKAFDRYYRVDDTAMRFQGLGLGLFISAEILKRHNGHFWVESEPGKGSVFYFSLPLNDSFHVVKPETDNRTFYKDNKVEVRYNPDKEWIEAIWKGFQTFDTVKHGCLEILTLLEHNHCSKMLNDNTQVLGNWSDSSEWGSKVWLPAMEKAGLRYFAWVHSESTFSKLNAQKITDFSNGGVETRFFEDRDEAQQWLENQESFAGSQKNNVAGEQDTSN